MDHNARMRQRAPMTWLSARQDQTRHRACLTDDDRVYGTRDEVHLRSNEKKVSLLSTRVPTERAKGLGDKGSAPCHRWPSQL